MSNDDIVWLINYFIFNNEQLNKNKRQTVVDLLKELKQRRESDLRPANKFLGNNLIEQFKHLKSEVKEVKSEFYYFIDDDYNEEFRKHSRGKLISELIDLQMSCETMLAIMGLNEEQRREARVDVIAKNEARGYYNKEEIK